MDTTPGTSPVEIEGELDSGTKRKTESTSSPSGSKGRKVEQLVDIIDNEMIVSELGGAALFVISCLDEMGLSPEDFATRPLSVLIQHLLKCGKTPESFVNVSKIQLRDVQGVQVNPLYISNLKRKYLSNNKLMVDRMPSIEPILKLQYACGHLSEVGNLHARQNDRILSAIVLPGIGTIEGKFTSAFVSGDSRNASAINVVKSMTVQGMVLFHYQLQEQSRNIKKDFKKTQLSILDVIQRRAGNNGARLRQAILDNKGDEIMAGLNHIIPVLMAGHGFLMEDVLAFWRVLRARDVPSLHVYLGYTKSDTKNGIDMFNLTVKTLPMPEAGAFKYLFAKFCLRGVGSAQFHAALELNCQDTDWLRMAVTAINHRGAYIGDPER